MDGFKIKNSLELTEYSGKVSVKAINRTVVLRAMIINGLTSRLDIAQHTGLSTATVSRIMNLLINEGLVEEVGTTLTGTRGCPPTALRFHGEVAHVVGVDIGESYIKFELVNILGSTLDTYMTTTDALLGGEVTLGRLITGYEKLIKKNGLTDKDIVCVCIGVPGIVNYEAGWVNVPDIKDWWNYCLAEKLQKTIKTKIVLECSSNCSVLGEYIYGCAKKSGSVAFLKISAGIGGGIMFNGKVLRGHNNAVGEFGFLLPYPENIQLESKKRGVFECMVGLNSIMSELKKIGVGTVDENNIPYMQTICQNAADGDEACQRIIDKNIKFYAQAAVNIAVVIDPEVFIVGGDIYPIGGMLKSKIEEYMNRVMPYVPKVMISELGADSSLKGASRIALESALRHYGIISKTEMSIIY